MRVKKPKPALPKCFICQKELTGKVSDAGGKQVCYRCFVQWRTKEREEQERQEKLWVGEWIRLKKYFCHHCQRRLNDLECVFTITGPHCTKCDTPCTRLDVEKPVQLLKKLNPDNY